MKHLKLTFSVLLISCFTGFNAVAASYQTPGLPVSGAIVLVMAVCLGFAIKVIAKKLKQVDQHLQDAFGEKVL